MSKLKYKSPLDESAIPSARDLLAEVVSAHGRLTDGAWMNEIPLVEISLLKSLRHEIGILIKANDRTAEHAKARRAHADARGPVRKLVRRKNPEPDQVG